MFVKYKINKNRKKLLRSMQEQNRDNFLKFLQYLAAANELANYLPTLLHEACFLGNCSEYLVLLMQHAGKKSINTLDERGCSCLHTAVMNGDDETVQTLLEYGADPNIRDQDGVTPMILCKSMNGIPEISEMLLKAGANPMLVDKHGKNYLM